MPTPTSPATSGNPMNRRSPAPPPSAARRRKPRPPPSGEAVRAGAERPAVPHRATIPLAGGRASGPAATDRQDRVAVEELGSRPLGLMRGRWHRRQRHEGRHTDSIRKLSGLGANPCSRQYSGARIASDGWRGDSGKYGAWQLLRACPLDHRTLPRGHERGENLRARPPCPRPLDRGATYSLMLLFDPEV